MQGEGVTPFAFQEYHKGGLKTMRKIRRFFQAVLFITFMVGVHDGMKAGNLVAVLVNGIIVLASIAVEKEDDK